MNETLKVLKERRSVRKYKAEQIRDEELNAILEAGTWAPTGMGLQSAVMVVVLPGGDQRDPSAGIDYRQLWKLVGNFIQKALHPGSVNQKRIRGFRLFHIGGCHLEIMQAAGLRLT